MKSNSRTMTPTKLPTAIDSVVACFAILLFSAPLAAQEDVRKEPVPEGWQIGAGLGADIGQLLLLNPRVGSGENRIGIGANLTTYANSNASD